jgi:hypothetical protein
VAQRPEVARLRGWISTDTGGVPELKRWEGNILVRLLGICFWGGVLEGAVEGIGEGRGRVPDSFEPVMQLFRPRSAVLWGFVIPWVKPTR